MAKHSTGRRMVLAPARVDRLDDEVYRALLAFQKEYGAGVLRYYVRGMVGAQGRAIVEERLRADAAQLGMTVEEFKQHANDEFSRLGLVPEWEAKTPT